MVLQLRCINLFGILHFAALGIGRIHFARLKRKNGEEGTAVEAGKWLSKKNNG